MSLVERCGIVVAVSCREATDRVGEIAECLIGRRKLKTRYFYTMLLRTLDYAEDYDIAELEIELEREHKLEEFIALCPEIHQVEWRRARMGAQKMARASAILHRMDPQTYPTIDTWSQSVGQKAANITVGRFVERAFELCAVRRPGKALIFIIDEVGQYVARSEEKIDNLRVLVEQFGRVGKNWLKAKKIPAPAWIIITSQEKLSEVVAALDSKKVELARLQDRFKYHIDLAPADIREVTSRRVLSKKGEALPILQQIYREAQGQLNVACHLERTSRKSEVSERDFVQFYPYLSHFVELSIDIMSGIRLQPGADKHYGGSNRTIIKQTYEMLVHERTDLASQPIGTLVTLDKVFNLVEGNLPSEKQKDISDITQRFLDDTEDQGMTTRVAKVIALLEFVHDLPRTENNIAACLVDTVGAAAPLEQVQRALEKLRAAQFVRNTEEGWKLQTSQEKNWDSERRQISPRTIERNDILREIIGEVMEKVKVHRYNNKRNFRVGVKVEQVQVGDEGQILLTVVMAEDSSVFANKVAEVRTESRQDGHKYDLYWVFVLTPEIEALVVDLYASRRMIAKYGQLSAQQRITTEESISLLHENNEMGALQRRLRDKMTQELERGTGLFRGIDTEADTLGRSLPEIFHHFFDKFIPDLYPKLEMGARNLHGNEAEEVLKAANLNALPQVFYNNEQGLNLIVKENDRYVPNPSADVAKEILDYITRKYAYGTRVTGKDLEEHFMGIGYGWERDMLRMVLAVLLRAGSIEVNYQGRRYRNHQEPQSRVPLTNNTAFKAASFSPREAVGVQTLTIAVVRFEEITGKEVDAEEGAIATAIKKLAEEENRQLHQILAEARANYLPVVDVLVEYQQILEQFMGAETDDCVRLLAGEGRSLYDAHERAHAIRHAVNADTLMQIRLARRAADEMAPALEHRSHPETLATQTVELRSLLTSIDFYAKFQRITEITQEIGTAYRQTYLSLHNQRARTFEEAIDKVKGHAEWPRLTKELQAATLAPLTSRACLTTEAAQTSGLTLLASGEMVCSQCHASLSQIESELAACSGWSSQVLARVRELTVPPPPVGARTERVRLAEFFNEPLNSEEAVDLAVTKLADYLRKLVEEGIRIIVE